MADIPVHISRVFYSPTAEEERFLPEGPRLLDVAARPVIAWVNIQTGRDATSGTVYLRDLESGGMRALPQPHRPGFLFPTDQAGSVVVGQGKEVGLLDLESNRWTPWITLPDANARTIINDGEIVPGGRAFVFGTKDLWFADPIAELYLFTLADLRLTRLLGGQVCSNGKVFVQSGTELTLLDIDTPKRNVVRYHLDLDNRSLTGGEVVLDLAHCRGYPDGMVDAGNGSVIIAFYNPEGSGPGHAYRFDIATGKVLEVWEVPGSPRVTCPLLIGNGDKVQLILTTATEGMAADLRARCPEAGSVFIAETSLTQRPQPELVRLGP